jgi:hypothetical protein
MTTDSTPSNNTTWATARPSRSRVRAVIGGGALAVGAMLLTATAAQADPTQIQTTCESHGGTYSNNGGGYESCCMDTQINDQGDHCWEYLDGGFLKTDIVPAPTSTRPPPRQLLPPGVAKLPGGANAAQ